MVILESVINEEIKKFPVSFIDKIISILLTENNLRLKKKQKVM